ncbi:MAG: hypothetical protein ACOZAO_00200 [Patescibacteria group bacterium]
MKRICATLIVILFLLSTAFPVFAADFELLTIGSLNTNGANYTDWWYTGINPLFTGIADPGSTITVTINGESSTTSADSSGIWAYASTLETGDHSVSFLSSGGETIAFTLHTGQSLPDTTETTTVTEETSESTTPVPDTGSSQIVLYIVSLSLISYGIYLLKYRKPALATFEEKVRCDLN